MRRLLPPLETLSEKHPDVFIQELASNLRAVIATHGAYRPEHFPSEAQGSRGPDTMPQNTRVPLMRQGHMQTEATDSQTSPPAPPLHSQPAGGGRTSGTSKPGPPVKPFSDLLLEACDPDVPTRAFALRVLTLMVRKQNPEAAQEREKVLMVGRLVMCFDFCILVSAFSPLFCSEILIHILPSPLKDCTCAASHHADQHAVTNILSLS